MGKGRGEGGEKIPGRLGRLAYVLVNLDDAPRARTSQAIRGLAGRSQSERERRQRARLREQEHFERKMAGQP